MEIDFSKYIDSDELTGEKSETSLKITKDEKLMKQVAENIRVSEIKRQEISKMIGKEPIEDTLLKALECISLMTGDKVFFEVNKEKIGGKSN